MPIIDLSSNYIGSAGGVPLYQVPDASMKTMEAILNATWDLANVKQGLMTAKFTDAQGTYLDGTPNVSVDSVTVPTLTAPTVTIPSDLAAADVNGDITAMIDTLATKFVAFRTAYFPDEQNAYVAAENWLQDAIANENGGIPESVQTALLEDDRSRILEDASRATDSVMASFASRGYPLPPGAAAGATIEIQRKAQTEIASSSRKLTALAIEMQKFNVEKLLDLRKSAMASAISYIEALTSSSAKVTGLGYDAQAKLISSAAEYYRAEISAADVISKVRQFNETIALDAGAKNQAAELQTIDYKLRAMLEEAKTVASMATSLFNNLNVSTSLRADGGTSVSSSPE